MNALYKGLLIAALHLAIVSSLGAKLLYDRSSRPHIWIKSAVFDPNLPIRGKYLSLSIEVPAEGFESQMQNFATNEYSGYRCNLVLRGGQLIAIAANDGEFWANLQKRESGTAAIINGEIAYFLPEHRNGPILHDRSEELWIEATIPRKGPPRPLRLGIKKNGVLTPLAGD